MVNELELKSPAIADEMHTSIDVLHGAPIPKLKRLETFDEDAWEDVTLELASEWKKQYHRVVRCGGGGDLGRDVVAYHSSGEWENFQCKHYANALTLDEAIREVGKLIYYAYLNEYKLPVKYYFVAPKGVQTKLLNCLMNTNMLKEELINRWDKQCKTKITSTKTINLDESLNSYIENSIDFSIFDHIPPLDIINLHSQTQYHAIRFGASSRKRPQPISPPSALSVVELPYTTELLSAFSEAEASIVTRESLERFPDYEEEYSSARKNYYYADGLEMFSRDWLPSGSYKELLDECYEAVSPIVKSKHQDGYVCYLEVSSQAARMNYSSHPLHHFIKTQDKKGFCHHLVNEKRIKWVKK